MAALKSKQKSAAAKLFHEAVAKGATDRVTLYASTDSRSKATAILG
jgi:hypothetical protein